MIKLSPEVILIINMPIHLSNASRNSITARKRSINDVTVSSELSYKLIANSS